MSSASSSLTSWGCRRHFASSSMRSSRPSRSTLRSVSVVTTAPRAGNTSRSSTTVRGCHGSMRAGSGSRIRPRCRARRAGATTFRASPRGRASATAAPTARSSSSTSTSITRRRTRASAARSCCSPVSRIVRGTNRSS